MAMSLLKKIDDYSVGGLNIDSSNILLNMGKPHEVTGRLGSRAGDAKFIKMFRRRSTWIFMVRR